MVAAAAGSRARASDCGEASGFARFHRGQQLVRAEPRRVLRRHVADITLDPVLDLRLQRQHHTGQRHDENHDRPCTPAVSEARTGPFENAS